MIKNFTLLFFAFLFSITTAYSQADLIITSSSLSSYTTNINQPLQVMAVVKNVGFISANNSIVYIYSSVNTTFTTIIGKVCIPSLAPLASYTVNYIYVPKQTISAGIYNIGLLVDGENTIAESNENNTYTVATPLQITAITSLSQKMPYPIIFIHGLNSNDATWDNTVNDWMSLWGMSKGGRLDFCLNADENINTSNFSTDYIDFTAANNQSNLQAADCYFINFDVDHLGNYDADNYTVQSNQSAIYKQGRAVSDAIKHVLQVTGKDKVVIIGHSMGGLATRTYLQNNSMWQADQKHHIAKLYTLGTPHGGSNATAGWLNALGGIDGNSEACRDLRYPSSLLGFPGKFLFGGLESTSNNGNVNNDDINCNGIIGDMIAALNSSVTVVPLDLNYTCLIGIGALNGGDGIVDEQRANINNYGLISPPATHIADTLIDNTFAFTESHTDLPGYAEVNVKGIDEPNYFNINNYMVDTNAWYMGFVNQQSKITSVTKDYDHYQFSNTILQSITLSVANNYHNDLCMKLINLSNAATITINTNGRSNVDTTININANNYALQIAAEPKADSWKYPYYFNIKPKTYIDLHLDTGIEQTLTGYTLFKVYPNPATQHHVMFSIYAMNAEAVTIQIANVSGQILVEKPIALIQGNNSTEVSTQDLDSGIYYCSLVFKNHATMHQQLVIIK